MCLCFACWIRYHKLNRRVCEVVEDFGLVWFVPLDVTDKMSMLVVVGGCDKANGYRYGAHLWSDKEKRIDFDGLMQ